MFLMVFYDFELRGGDFAGRTPRFSFVYVMILLSFNLY